MAKQSPVEILLTPHWLHWRNADCTKLPGTDAWAPARPVNWELGWWRRALLAWKVFRGRADALVWPQDEPERYMRYLANNKSMIYPELGWPGVDRQIVVATKHMTAEQRKQPRWLWFDAEEGGSTSFGRWGAGAPYIRADLTIPGSAFE